MRLLRRKYEGNFRPIGSSCAWWTGIRGVATFFGISREHAPMPESYLRELQRLVGAASAHLGVVVRSNERHAYWIDGRSLGVLS